MWKGGIVNGKDGKDGSGCGEVERVKDGSGCGGVEGVRMLAGVVG